MQNDLKIKPGNLFFFLGTLAFTLNILTYQALELSEYKYILRILGMFFFSVTILLRINSIKVRWTLLILVIYASGVMMLGETGAKNNAVNLVAIIVIMISAQCVQYPDLKEIFCKVAIISIIVWGVLLLLGVIPIIPVEAQRQEGIGASMHTIVTIRYSIGFLYEINLGAWYITSALTIIFLCKKKSLVTVIVTTVINTIVYLITDSRTTFLFYLIFLFGFGILYIFMRNKYATSRVQHMVWLLYLGIFLLPLLSEPLMKRAPWMDSFFSGRLRGIAAALNGMSVYNFFWGGYGIQLSCFYYLLLAEFGLFVYVYFYLILRKGTIFYLSRHYYDFFSFLVALSFVGLMEGSIFAPEELSTIVFWSLIGKALSSKEKDNNTEILSNSMFRRCNCTYEKNVNI